MCRWPQECSEYLTRHRLADKAEGKPVVTVPLVLYTDDTSGNKSKKWHLFNSWNCLLAGLPRKQNTQLSNIHFVCCSDRVSVLEMAQPIVEELLDLEREGITIYDAHLDCEVLAITPVLCILADNPRASEVVSHLRGAATKFCRMCMVRLQYYVYASITQYTLQFPQAAKSDSPPALGPPRSSLSSLRQILEIRRQPTEAGKAALRKQYGLTDVPNPLLSLPLDLYQ